MAYSELEAQKLPTSATTNCRFYKKMTLEKKFNMAMDAASYILRCLKMM